MNPLIAIVLALAVLGIGIIGYFSTYSSAASGATSQNVSQNIQSIFSQVTQDFGNSPNNFTGFDNTDAIQAGVVPASWVPSGSTTIIDDDWGGAVTFGVVGINGGTNNGWTMTLSDVPENECSSTADFYTPQTYEILINGSAIDANPAYGGTTGSWPPPAATIQAACSQTKSTVEWEVAGN